MIRCISGLLATVDKSRQMLSFGFFSGHFCVNFAIIARNYRRERPEPAICCHLYLIHASGHPQHVHYYPKKRFLFSKTIFHGESIQTSSFILELRSLSGCSGFFLPIFNGQVRLPQELFIIVFISFNVWRINISQRYSVWF